MICLFGNLHSQTLELTINISYPDAEMGLEDGVSEVCIVSNPAFISTAWGDGCLPILPVSEMSTTAVLPDFPEYNLTFIYYCDGDTVIIPVQLIEANLLNLSCEIEISCGSSGPTDWDCPDLIANIGASCQGGWGVVNENCDCVESEMNCLDAAGLDIGLLMAYFSTECANQNNVDSWWYCGLIETLVAAEMGDGEACATIVEWVEANDWDGTWNPGNGGGNTDCPIEGKWLFEADSPSSSNTMYEFADGLRYTYYCSGTCDAAYWSSLEISDAIPNPNPYTFDGETLTIDLFFGNTFTQPVVFECDCDKIVWDDSLTSQYDWVRVGFDPNSCGSSIDCAELGYNVGDSCQGGWGVVDENCDCVQVEMDCLGAAGLDITLLMAYFSNECANQNNVDSWWYCGLMETLVAAEMGDGEACATIVEWVEANNWTDALDCPELGGNIGDYCINLDGTLGEISEGCVCVEDTTWCDLEVITNLLSNDDGSGNGSVEAVVEGGEAPYTYIWESWNGGVIGTEAILNNCVAGSYFVQVTDYDGCVAFGGEDVGLSVDTLDWDCLNLNMNIGDPCQSGWGVIDENCDCVEDLFSEGCLAGFSVVQAYEENNVIPFELFVYLENYDDSNDYYWSFGDEGSSTDPFPTWIYETNGPYVLCLTVSNEADSCSTTYCQNIAIDSLGWVDGLQDGFTINVLNGNENSTIGIEVAPEDLFSFSVFPNPIIGSELHVHWVSSSLNNVESTIMSLEGKIVARHTSANSSTGSSMTINVDQLSPGMYVLQVRQGFRTQSKTVVIP